MDPQITDTRISNFVCPICHGSLESIDDAWVCTICERRYPLRDSIPDFLEVELAQEKNISQKRIHLLDRSMGWLSKIYETRLWYSVFIDLIFGWNRTSLEQIAAWMKEAIPTEAKRILDVASGPATYGRRLAAPGREVYGIDISLGMLRQGQGFLEQERISNVFLARSLAERLPFRDHHFDAAICSGSLHLFSEPGHVLAEIQRTLRPGAPLAVMTLLRGESGILRSRFIRRLLPNGMRVFERDELLKMLSETGYDGFKDQVFGSGIYFVTNKQSGE